MDLSPQIADAISAAAAANGLDPQMLSQFAKIESGYDPSNKTPSGTYQGLFQLSNQEFKKYGGGNILDPVDNANAAARKLAAESAQFQAQYGRAPTATDLYLIHNQGAGGYAAHMANPDAPAWQNMASTAEGREKGPAWARAAVNGNYYGPYETPTSGQFYDFWHQKIDGGQPATAVASAPQSAPTAPQSAPAAQQPTGLLSALASLGNSSGAPAGGVLGQPSPANANRQGVLASLAQQQQQQQPQIPRPQWMQLPGWNPALSS